MQLIFKNVEESILVQIKNKLNGLEHSSKVILPEKLIFYQLENISIDEKIKIREQILLLQAPIIFLSKSPQVSKTAWKMYAAYFVDMEANDWLNDLKTGFEKFLLNNAALFVQKIEIPSIKNKDYINPNDITFIKASGNYSEIYFRDKTKLMVNKKLKELEVYFKARDFIERFGKSIIINLNNIRSIKAKTIEFTSGSALEFPKYNNQFPYLKKRLLWEVAKINYEEKSE